LSLVQTVVGCVTGHPTIREVLRKSYHCEIAAKD
jgi:hypothetical protein